MEKCLFDPHRMETPPNLILIPRFWDAVYYDQLKSEAIGDLKLLNSDIFLFENYTAVIGFLGYPHILTILEFIRNVRAKNIYFLGTAGSMNNDISEPVSLEVEEINSSTAFNCFDQEDVFSLETFEDSGLRKARGVTVDIIQRETEPWLREQVGRGMDFVEMEIYPLRVFLEKAFHAIVVTTDMLNETGVEVFPEKKQLRQEFVKSFELIVDHINKNGSKW
ncbi:MAG: hypothetical protein GY757_39455 [bacterium]|nr:hypothetical protein [bacterium]